MKTYPAKKQLRNLGIVMLIAGLLLSLDDICILLKLPCDISLMIGIGFITLGLIHIFQLNKFE